MYIYKLRTLNNNLTTTTTIIITVIVTIIFQITCKNFTKNFKIKLQTFTSPSPPIFDEKLSSPSYKLISFVDVSIEVSGLYDSLYIRDKLLHNLNKDIVDTNQIYFAVILE